MKILSDKLKQDYVIFSCLDDYKDSAFPVLPNKYLPEKRLIDYLLEEYKDEVKNIKNKEEKRNKVKEIFEKKYSLNDNCLKKYLDVEKLAKVLGFQYGRNSSIYVFNKKLPNDGYKVLIFKHRYVEEYAFEIFVKFFNGELEDTKNVFISRFLKEENGKFKIVWTENENEIEKQDIMIHIYTNLDSSSWLDLLKLSSFAIPKSGRFTRINTIIKSDGYSFGLVWDKKKKKYKLCFGKYVFQNEFDFDRFESAVTSKALYVNNDKDFILFDEIIAIYKRKPLPLIKYLEGSIHDFENESFDHITYFERQIYKEVIAKNLNSVIEKIEKGSKK